MVVYVLSVLIAVWGLTAAYSTWLVFLIAVTAVYAVFAVDPYYFQLRKQGKSDDEAAHMADELGQDIFPSGSAWDSLKISASNRRTWA